MTLQIKVKKSEDCRGHIQSMAVADKNGRQHETHPTQYRQYVLNVEKLLPELQNSCFHRLSNVTLK